MPVGLPSLFGVRLPYSGSVLNTTAPPTTPSQTCYPSHAHLRRKFIDWMSQNRFQFHTFPFREPGNRGGTNSVKATVLKTFANVKVLEDFEGKTIG